MTQTQNLWFIPSKVLLRCLRDSIENPRFYWTYSFTENLELSKLAQYPAIFFYSIRTFCKFKTWLKLTKARQERPPVAMLVSLGLGTRTFFAGPMPLSCSLVLVVGRWLTNAGYPEHTSDSRCHPWTGTSYPTFSLMSSVYILYNQSQCNFALKMLSLFVPPAIVWRLSDDYRVYH